MPMSYSDSPRTLGGVDGEKHQLDGSPQTPHCRETVKLRAHSSGAVVVGEGADADGENTVDGHPGSGGRGGGPRPRPPRRRTCGTDPAPRDALRKEDASKLARTPRQPLRSSGTGSGADAIGATARQRSHSPLVSRGDTSERCSSSPRTPLSAMPSNLATVASSSTWLDPFPTPDASLQSRINSGSDDVGGDGAHGRVHSAEAPGANSSPSSKTTTTTTTTTTIPEMMYLDETYEANGEGGPRPRLSCAVSYPGLPSQPSLEVATLRPLPLENGGPSMGRSLSIGRIWGALTAGPDGNEWPTEDDRGSGQEEERKLGIRKESAEESVDDEPRSSPSRRERRRDRLPRAVVTAGELVLTPVRAAGRSCVATVRTTRRRLGERKELRRQRRLARRRARLAQQPPRSWWIVIPADHPCKVAWDVLTMTWAVLGAWRTHVRIRDRVFDQSPLILLTEVLFAIDILLNFVTEHKTRQGQVIRDGRAVWARYLTTWFLVDVLSLVPWERIYVQPVVERLQRRNFFQKTLVRSKIAVRISRVLRGRHIKLFGQVSKQTGTPLRRLVALLIRYLPKYLVFLRNMRGALVVRALHFVHWLHNLYKKIWVKARRVKQSLVRRKASHPIFELVEPHEDDDSDSDSDYDYDSDDDDSDKDDDIDTASESLDDNENNDSMFSLDDDDNDGEGQCLRGVIRASSEVSPLASLRRRAYSQNHVNIRE